MTTSTARPPQPDGRVAVPWELAVIGAIPTPPLVAGALVAAAMVSAYFLLRWMLGLPVLSGRGESGFLLNPTAHLGLCVSLIAGYALGAVRHVRERMGQDLATFFAGRGQAHSFREREIPVDDLHSSRLWGCLSAALAGVVLAVAHKQMIASALSPPWTLVDALSLAPGTLLLFWMVGRFAFWSVQDAGSAAGFEIDDVPVDLLELRKLDVFGRIALRFALVWIVGLSIFLVLVLPMPGLEAVTLPVLPLVLGIFGIAVATFLLPVRNVNRRVRAAKQSALDDLQAELSRRIEGTMSNDGHEPGRLTDLLTLSAYVEALREWPFDSSTIGRFALYLLIPIGSWVGGAMVERVIDVLLG